MIIIKIGDQTRGKLQESVNCTAENKFNLSSEMFNTDTLLQRIALSQNIFYIMSYTNEIQTHFNA